MVSLCGNAGMLLWCCWMMLRKLTLNPPVDVKAYGQDSISMTAIVEGRGNTQRKCALMSLNQLQANNVKPLSPSLYVHPIMGQESCKDQPIKPKGLIQSKIYRVWGWEEVMVSCRISVDLVWPHIKWNPPWHCRVWPRLPLPYENNMVWYCGQNKSITTIW